MIEVALKSANYYALV